MSDQQRDAAADLAVCAAATRGPWQANPAFGTPWTVGGDLANFHRCVIVCETYPAGGINCPQEDFEQGAADARFIALAREALPWWIQEALVRQAIIDGYSQAIDDQHAEIERLAAENARLKQTISNMEENL